jgi:transcriptional regulator with XRE-family HTH domain/tetratricopeptide (TPR) repeat protein
MLAERAGLSAVIVRKLEQNARRSARISTLSALARALDIPVGILLGGTPASEPTGALARPAHRVRVSEAGQSRPTLLRALITQRHWQRFQTFEAQFRHAARELAEHDHDPDLAKLTVSSRQWERWYAGSVKTEPHPDACRVLEHMFGYPVQQLLAIRETGNNQPYGYSEREILGRDESDLWPDAVTGQTRAPEKFGVVSADTSPPDSMAVDFPEPGPDTIVLSLRLGGKEVIIPISRRFLLRAGVSSFVEAFALDQQFDMVNDIMQRSRRAERLTIASPAHLQEILIHLREQWHALVKTDNLLGPRFALAGVLNQISVVEALRSILRDEQRIEVARLGAKYAESAAWLYEDTDNMTQARSWTSQAMEWAYEGNDERMLAWTIFRRAQQAAAVPDAAQTIGLAQAARRNEEKLATPTRAAIRVQEAYGHALDGNDQAAQRLLDEAHTWAAGDAVGDAREGHGSYCTPSYIEIQRGHCWLAAGQPKKAISLYEDSLRTLPTVYQRNRAATLTRLAVAYAADSQPEQAANTAHVALPVARSAGSKRIVGEIKNVGTELIPYRALPAVAALLDELEAEDH